MKGLKFYVSGRCVRGPANYLIGVALCCSALLFVKPSPCHAQTTTIDFDPPQFTAGQQLQSVGIVTFPDSPVVFAPSGATTFTPPYALRSAQVCNNAQCSTGAFMMRMYFAQLLNSLSLRAGNFSGTLCIPENGPCDVFARLEGFDVNGNPVADSGDFVVGDAVHGDITTQLAISDSSGRIASATLFMGKGTAHSDYGNPVPAQIDHLVFTSTGVPTSGTGTPPSITITAPTPLQSFSYPFQVTFSGTVSAPAGPRAFCTALNNVAIPASNQCTQVGLLDLSGSFSVWIQVKDLTPGTNTLSAFVYDLGNQSATATVTFSLQAPPPPSIAISAPTADYCLEGIVPSSFVWGVVLSGVCSLSSASNITMTGGGTMPGGLLAFCTGANEAQPPPAGQCNQAAALNNATLSFLNVPVPPVMLAPGLNTLDVYAYDRWGQLAQAHVNVVLPADPRIIAMEVTQGIQTTAIPLNTPGSPVAYSGVRLFAGGKTIVRVFANTTAGTLPDVDVLLLGTRDQYDTGVQSQFLGLLFPDNGNLTLAPGGTTVSLAQRADPQGAYVFTLPSDWVAGGGGSITLYAVVNPQGFAVPPVPSCSGCQANSMMTLTGVTFENLNAITISPIAITWADSSGNHSPNADPTAVFAAAANISPLSTGGLNVLPYHGMLDISNLISEANSTGQNSQWLSGKVLDLVSQVEDISDPPGYLIGVAKGSGLTDLGLESPHAYVGLPGPPRVSDIAVVDENRPVGSVAHEFFHQLHYYHAGMSCPNISTFGYPAVPWPPDDRGDIQGIGLDRSSETGGTYNIIAPGAPNQLTEVVDFMSYCIGPGDSNAWISVRNWNSWGGLFPNGLIPCDLITGCASVTINEQPASPNQETLRVAASVDPSGKAAILRVAPGDGKRIATGSNTTDRLGYTLVVRDSAGHIVSKTPVSPVASDGWLYFNAEVLASNAARVEVEHNGSVVASRDRSAHAPTITLLNPTPGTQLSGTLANLVKWQAQDADGDPLSVRVEYSVDDGKNYRVLTAGVSGNQTFLPSALFSRSERARIRVRVNDGFNEAIAVSGLLKAPGSPPVVHILEPVPGSHYRNDVSLSFVGKAYDDAGNPIPPDSLKWYDGDRALGHGGQFFAFDREPGRRTIRLIARDQDREAAASVDVYIDAVAPIFIGLKIPQTVDHGEDEMQLVVGSSIPGVVVIGDRGYPVEIKPKQLTIPISKGKEDITLPLVLVAEGKTTTAIARIKRK
jgi:hypothetical protein